VLVRADRLVALLLLLQARGRVTAAEAATELEVSERTARRDLEALGMAGIPVYSQQGRGGGWQLLGGARTDLSGLSAPEARALFLVAGPASSATPEVKAALRKLMRALPEPLRPDAEAASSAIVVDPGGWGRPAPHRPPPIHLDALQQAVIDAEQVTLGYVARDGSATTRDVHPLGLASKGTAWYLVAATDAGQRTFRVDRVTSVGRTGRPVVRPDGFDLAESWRLITEEVGERLATVWARGSAAPDIVPVLRGMFGRRVRLGPPGGDGRVAIEVGESSPEAVAWRVAPFGKLVRIHEPAEVVAHLARIGAELVEIYAPAGADPPPGALSDPAALRIPSR
jgi:predicted DNA-binding transcriptional regulator YafY